MGGGDMPRDGTKNLQPYKYKRSAAEAQKNGKKGGIRSGEVRRQKRDMRIEMIAALDAIDEQGLTERQKIIRRVVKMANGSDDPRWVKMAAELSGELPEKKVSIDADVNTPPQVHIYIPDNGRDGLGTTD